MKLVDKLPAANSLTGLDEEWFWIHGAVGFLGQNLPSAKRGRLSVLSYGEDDDDWSEEENWDGAGHETWDVDDSDPPDGAGTVRCQNCGTEVYEDASQCPTCGDYILPSKQESGFPKWMIWLAFLIVFAILFGYIAPLL